MPLQYASAYGVLALVLSGTAWLGQDELGVAGAFVFFLWGVLVGLGGGGICGRRAKAVVQASGRAAHDGRLVDLGPVFPDQ